MKHYTHTDAARLIDEVERQGGQFLAETCMSHEIDGLVCKAAPKPPLSTGCEEEALFLVPYDPSATVRVPTPVLEPDDHPDAPDGRQRRACDEEGVELWTMEPDEGTPTNVLSAVKVCANDDLMRAWPRFAGVIRDRDPMENNA